MTDADNPEITRMTGELADCIDCIEELEDICDKYWRYILALEARLLPDQTPAQIALADAVIARRKAALEEEGLGSPSRDGRSA